MEEEAEGVERRGAAFVVDGVGRSFTLATLEAIGNGDDATVAGPSVGRSRSVVRAKQRRQSERGPTGYFGRVHIRMIMYLIPLISLC